MKSPINWNLMITLTQCEQYNLDKQEIENDLLQLDANKTAGIILRSKCLWYEKGEKSNKYFLNMIKRNANKTTMNKLQTEDGRIVYNPDDILNCQAEYYEQLYMAQGNKSYDEIKKYISDIETPTLTKD